MTRHDDLPAYIAELEAESQGKKRVKIDQMWEGAAVVPFSDKLDPLTYVDDIKRNKRWNVVVTARGASWLELDLSYHAKGANADDAESMLATKFGIAPENVRIDTHRISAVSSI